MRLTSTAFVLLSAGAHAKVILVLGDSAAAFSGAARARPARARRPRAPAAGTGAGSFMQSRKVK